MFKPTQFLSVPMRRLRMTSKRGPKKGYYKGNRTGTVGTHTKYGGFLVNYNKVRTYVCDLATVNETNLRPFVANLVAEPKKTLAQRYKGLTDGEIFLKKWKELNGTT